MILNVMIGIPASGKSAFVRQNKEEKDYVISSDSVRMELFGDESCQADNSKVFGVVYQRMIEALRFGRDVWLDATNINRKSRRRIFEELKQAHIRDNVEVRAIVIAIPWEVCFERDSQRERTVGKNVILKFLHRFEYPQKFEGFDDIQVYWDHHIDSYDRVKADVESMKGFDQKNPWHHLDLWGHTQKIVDNCRFKFAAFCHDIGKLFTQQIGEDGVAHYYRHENFSAYYTMCFCAELSAISGFNGDFDETMFLVNYHMLGHQIKDERKWKQVFGEWYDDLLEFCSADNVALS